MQAQPCVHTMPPSVGVVALRMGMSGLACCCACPFCCAAVCQRAGKNPDQLPHIIPDRKLLTYVRSCSIPAYAMVVAVCSAQHSTHLNARSTTVVAISFRMHTPSLMSLAVKA